MNKLFRLGLLLSFVMASISCNDNDDDRLYYSYVTVEALANGSELTLRRDAGAFLYVTSSSVNLSNIAVGDRLIVYYRLRSNANSGEDNFNIHLRNYYMVLTKDPILLSVVNATPGQDVALGDDPVRMNDIWFGGRYLNVNFSFYYTANSTVSHFINLVADDVDFDGTTMTVYFRHNAYADIPTVVSQTFSRSSIVSFDFVNLLDELDLTTSPDFVLVWYEYDRLLFDQPVIRRERALGKFTPWMVDRTVTTAMVNDLTDRVL